MIYSKMSEELQNKLLKQFLEQGWENSKINSRRNFQEYCLMKLRCNSHGMFHEIFPEKIETKFPAQIMEKFPEGFFKNLLKKFLQEFPGEYLME